MCLRPGTAYPEIVETCYNGWNGLEGEGSQYGYWNGKVTQNYSSNACLKKYRAKNLATSAQPTSAYNWWERSVNPTNATHFANMNGSGDPSYYLSASYTYGVCPCFCHALLLIYYSMRAPKAQKPERRMQIERTQVPEKRVQRAVRH